MRKFIFYFIIFNLFFLNFSYSNDGHKEDLAEEATDTVGVTIHLPPAVRRKSIVQSLPHTMITDYSSAASASPPIDVNSLSYALPSAALSEEERDFLEKKDRYEQLVKKIEDRTVTDTDVFQALREEFLAGTDLDNFHQIFECENLVEILMKVTRPYDWVYEAGGIIKDSNNDNFRHCFRGLGNELYLVDLHEEYKNMTITFKGSHLEKRLINPNIVNESCECCCVVQ